MARIAFVANDNMMIVDGLRDIDGAYQNSATVQVISVTDQVGANVSGQSFPLTLTYVAASNGRYRGVLQDSLALIDSQTYIATVTVDTGASQARFVVPFVARTRRFR